MKLNYSNKQLLDSLSKSYDIKKGDNKKLIIYAVIGAAAGATVTAYFLTSHQRRRMKEMASNLERQADIENQLFIQNQNSQQSLNNDLIKKAEVVDDTNDSSVTDVSA